MVYKNIKYTISIFLMLTTSVIMAQEIVVHDPVVIKQNDTYYLYCTGNGISVFSSKDLKNWNKEPQVFKEKPVWADGVAADFKNHIWAPDISFHNNTYYLYYSVSAFAKNIISTWCLFWFLHFFIVFLHHFPNVVRC